MTIMRKLVSLTLILILAAALAVGVTPTVLAEQSNDKSSFDILVFGERGWQLQGQLSFFDYETLQLPLDNNAGQLKVRLEQH